jgi:hypothetical protein
MDVKEIQSFNVRVYETNADKVMPDKLNMNELAIAIADEILPMSPHWQPWQEDNLFRRTIQALTQQPARLGPDPGRRYPRRSDGHGLSVK